MSKYSAYGFDPFYDFNGDGKLDALEAGFKLHGEMMEMDAIINRKPLDYFAAPTAEPDFSDDDFDNDDFDFDVDSFEDDF